MALTISTDKSKLDLQLIHTYLSKESYWAKNIPYQTLVNSIENSICFGAYIDDKQVGFARVITDKSTFAYIADVFVLSEHRGKGISKKLMKFIKEFPELQGLRRWVLATLDAHKLYEQFDFKPLEHPDRFMEHRNPTVYQGC